MTTFVFRPSSVCELRGPQADMERSPVSAYRGVRHRSAYQPVLPPPLPETVEGHRLPFEVSSLWH